MNYKLEKAKCEYCYNTHYYQYITYTKIYCYNCGRFTDYKSDICKWEWA